MKTVRVKITGSTSALAWYADLVGQVFEVYDGGVYRLDYILKEDYDKGHSAPWRHISKDDCVEVEDG